MGIAGLPFGGGRYFLGSMTNFLALTNITAGPNYGDVKGCLTPDGSTPTLYHAKPMIIQGAYIAAKQTGTPLSTFRPFMAAMDALLAYWNSPTRVDPVTGLHQWHDQLESGQDNLVFSLCPSSYSPECWDEARDAFTLAAPDLEVWLLRELKAYSLFLTSWAAEEADEGVAAGLRAKAAAVERDMQLAAGNLDTYFLVDGTASGFGLYYGAWNTSIQQQITNRTFQAAWPLWAGVGVVNASVAAAVVSSLQLSDLWTPYGIRSVSSLDPRYANDNIIDPYSEWRGPLWVNVIAITAHALGSYGYTSLAAQLADNVVNLLAADITQTGTWHECYSSANFSGLAAPGFLSWNTLGATLQRDIAYGIDPFALP